MNRPFAKLERGGAPVVWLGANFWSRAGGPLMWRSYDGEMVRAELAVLRRHGLGVTRSFFFWPHAMPEPYRLDADVVDRYADFLDAHVEAGMATIPTFVVGHMSGENWDPPWRGGRDLYRDTWMVARQAWYVRQLVARFAGHPAVAGWLISNEMPLYGGPADADAVTSWAELMVQAVRAGGGTQPVSLGDGAWGLEVTGHDNGYSVRRLGDIVDFVGPHVYRMETDVVRQHLKSAFVCELAAVGRRPVVLEEFGLSSAFASADNAGHYYRQQLHLSLLGGATGWIAWNNTDYDQLVGQDPYRHHPFEMYFGITTSDGTPKTPLHELAAFRAVLDAVEPGRCERLPAQAALIVSSYLDAGYPFTDEADRALALASLEQAHVAAREADLPLAFVREGEGVPDGCRLYIVPSVKQLTGPTWLRLRDLAASGAGVYVSYGTGESGVQRGPWWADVEPLFGVRNRLMYGLNDPIEDGVVHLRFERDLGSIRTGEVLTFAVGGGPNARAYLPVDVTDGPDVEVLARDGHDRPALVRKRHGDGFAVLCTYPVEYLAAVRARVNPEPTWMLYRALAQEAGVRSPVRVDDPAVIVDGLVRDDGRSFVWLVSERPAPVVVRPVLDSGVGPMVPLGGGDPLHEIELPPYGVRVVELQRSV